jgi:hypothetical protein
VIEYTAPAGQLELSGSNSVEVDIEDMVGNQMDTVSKSFQLP